MRPSDTASGMVHKPELGEYCFTYDIHVDCRNCQKDATIGSRNGQTVFYCEHCGWTDNHPLEHDDLIKRIGLGIAKL